MKILLKLIILQLLFLNYLFSQDAQFEKKYGNNDNYEVGKDVKQSVDGDYIVFADNNLFNSKEIYVQLLKTDRQGDLIWNQKYLPPAGKVLSANSFDYLGDKGYILLCSYKNNPSEVGNASKIYLIRTDIKGDTIWTKLISSQHGYLYTKLISLNHGKFVVAGTRLENEGPINTSAGAFIIKFDSLANIIWERSFEGERLGEQIRGFDTTLDNGFIMTGVTNSGSLFILKTDSAGNFEWQRALKIEDSYTDGYSIIKTRDEGYIITGVVYNDILIVKTNFEGSVKWYKRISGSNALDTGTCIVETAEMEYVLTGFIINNNWDLFLGKFSRDGNEIWQRTYGSNSDDKGYSIVVTQDNGYLITGENNKDIYLIKTNELGLTEINGKVDEKLFSIGEFSVKQNYPNPFNPETTIKYTLPVHQSVYNITIKIYNSLGQLLEVLVNKQQTPGLYTVKWNAINYPSGVYFYTLQTESFTQTRKMILLR